MLTRLLVWLRAFIWGMSVLYAATSWVFFTGGFVLIILVSGSFLLQGVASGGKVGIGIVGAILFLLSLSTVVFKKCWDVLIDTIWDEEIWYPLRIWFLLGGLVLVLLGFGSLLLQEASLGGIGMVGGVLLLVGLGGFVCLLFVWGIGAQKLQN